MALSLTLFHASFQTWTTVLFAVAATWWAVRTWLSYRRLQHIKGPWLASISNLWVFYHTCRSQLYLAGQEALRRDGMLSMVPVVLS